MKLCKSWDINPYQLVSFFGFLNHQQYGENPFATMLGFIFLGGWGEGVIGNRRFLFFNWRVKKRCSWNFLDVPGS